MNKLHLGCGNKILEGYVNVDKVAAEGVDVVSDVTQGLKFEDNFFEEVLCEDFLEHIPQEKVIYVMNETWRVMKNGGLLKIHVPEAPGVCAFQDPTHLSYWNEEAFTYFLCGHKRRNDYGICYGVTASFKLKDLKRLQHAQAKKYKKLGMPNYLLDIELIAVKN